jgi:UDP-N-acetyl-2-amino-2-deoxyglucuronate dehydrogenase
VSVRVGIVGCGHVGFIHSYTLHQLIKHGLVDARVTATHDIVLERAATFALAHGAVACDDVDAVLDQVDAVWVCTWTAGHHDVVAAAAARGLAIFCEKPLAPSLPECEAVARLLSTVPHQVGLVLRHAPVFQALVDEVTAGRHGRPLAVVFRDDQYFPVQGVYASEWRADVARAGGGTLFEHSIHDVDVLRWLLGDPTTVRADVASRYEHPGIDDVAALTLTFADETIATLTSVWHQILSRGSTRRVEVFCDDALVWLDDDHTGPLHVESSDRSEIIEPEPPRWVGELAVPPALTRMVGEYAPATKSFLDALAADGTAAAGFPDAATALAAHRVVDAAYRSAAAGGEAITPAPR